MTISLSTAAIAAFDSEIKLAYQDSGKLGDTVRMKSGVVGSTYRFPKLASGVATPRAPQTDVVPMNLVHSNRTATLEDWNAADFTDIFNDAATNVDEKSALARSIAMAISRREDQLIIDALEASGTTLTVDSAIGGANTSLNVDKLRRGLKLLGENGVSEDEELYFVGNYASKEGILGETEVTSSDFNSVRALVNGEVNSFLGIRGYKWIANRTEGGLDLTANERTNFIYAKNAVGLAKGIEARTEVNYIPMKTSWLANGIFKAGAIDIDAFGIVDMETWEA